MKKILFIALILFVFFACTKKENNKEIAENKQLKIVTTLFPTYDFSKELGQDKVDVNFLIPSFYLLL